MSRKWISDEDKEDVVEYPKTLSLFLKDALALCAI